MQLVLRLSSLATFVRSWPKPAALATATLAVGGAIRGQSLLPDHPTEAGVWYACSAALFVVGLWPLVSPPPVPAAASTAAAPLRRLWPLGVAVLLSAVALVLFYNRTASTTVIGLWAESLAVSVLVAWWLNQGRRPGRSGLTWTMADSVLLVGVVALAAFFRIWHLDYLPGVVGDEAPHVEFAHKVLSGEVSTPFQEGYWGNSAMIDYFTAGLMLLGFDDILALKLTGVVPGVLTVAFLFLLLRELLSRPAAAVGAGMLAVSSWDLVNSRFGYAWAVDALSVTAVLYFLVRGLRTGRHLDFAVAGLWLGFGLLMNRVAGVTPVLVVVLGAYFLWQKGWRRAWDFRWQALILVLVAGLFFAPRALYVFQEGPSKVLARQQEMFLFSKTAWADAKAHPMRQVAENTKDYLLMFNYHSGAHSRWNARPFHPALDVATGALVVLGLAYVLSRLRSWPSAVLLSTLLVMLIPGAISLALEDQPTQFRAVGVVPAVFGLAAVPVWLFWEALPQRRSRVALSLAALALLGFSAYDNYDAYFEGYGQSIGAYYNTERPETWAAKEVLRLSGNYEVYLTATELHAQSVAPLVQRHASYNVLDELEDLPVEPPAEAKGIAFIVMMGQHRSPGILGPEILDRLQTLYPGGQVVREERDPEENVVGVTYLVSYPEARNAPKQTPKDGTPSSPPLSRP